MNDRRNGQHGAAGMKAAFDASFAERPAESGAREEGEPVLRIRVAGAPFAFRVAEVSRLLANRPIVPAPSGLPEFAGLAGFRSAAIPVYDLAALAGAGGGSPGRWVALARSADVVGFAFDAFDGQTRVAREDFVPLDAERAGRSFAREAIRGGDALVPVFSVSDLVEAIRAKIGR